MFRLAHISDVHLGPLPALTFLELFSKRITGFVNWHRNRRRHLFTNTLDIVLDDIERQNPDHLAITGDLVNLASSLEIAAVKREGAKLLKTARTRFTRFPALSSPIGAIPPPAYTTSG